MKLPILAFIYPPEVDRLAYPADCPFKTERAGLTRGRLRSLGLLDGPGRSEVVPARASLQDLLRFHTPEYLSELERLSLGGELTPTGVRMGLDGPDTPVFVDAFEYGCWACGSALKGADLLLHGEAEVAFSLTGGFHHAMAGNASGFCYLNDAVLACTRLADAGKRVLYLDVDAHHGDGVQEAFYSRKDVMTLSLHESGKTLFPWGGFENEIGEGEGFGFNVNVPLPAWTYNEAFVWAWNQTALPLLRAFGPDVIVLELGMDTLAGDPLTHLQMTNAIVPEVLNPLLASGRPLLVLGGGGYHVENTVRAWALAWRTCCGEEADTDTIGLGGIMLESTEWAGGLCDRTLPVYSEQRQAVEPELSETIQRIARTIFPLHGLRQSLSAADSG